MSNTREPRFKTKVWDLPLRLFHWLLTGLLVLSYVTGEWHWNRVHYWSGCAILALLVFRLFWGFFGSETSRFTSFLGGPAKAMRYLAEFRRPGPDNQIGHNAIGGYMVLLMLALVAAQVGLGLFATSGHGFHGPLAPFIDPALSHRIGHWHSWNVNLLLALVALHVVAILFYALFKRHNLLMPMITGKKRLPGRFLTPRMESPVKALALFALSLTIVWVVLRIGQAR